MTARTLEKTRTDATLSEAPTTRERDPRIIVLPDGVRPDDLPVVTLPPTTLGEPSTPEPERRARGRLTWLLLAIGTLLVVAIALMVSRSGTTTTRSFALADLGTIEFDSVQVTDVWRDLFGGSARPSDSDDTFVVVRATLIEEQDQRETMNWANDILVSHTDSSVIDDAKKSSITSVSRADADDVARAGPSVTWVYVVPDGSLEGLSLDLGDAGIVHLRDLPAYDGS